MMHLRWTRTFFFSVLIGLVGGQWVPRGDAAEIPVDINFSAGYTDRTNTVARATLSVPPEFADVRTVEVTTRDGETLVGQLTHPRLLSEASTIENKLTRELTLRLEDLPDGEVLYLTNMRAAEGNDLQSYQWHEVGDHETELRLGDRPVLRYMHQPFDPSSRESIEATKKPFHHVFDPSGKRLVTKGPGGLYSHHRGLFYGFNRITYGDGKSVDTWHANSGESTSHQAFLSDSAGPVLGRHLLSIDWRGKDGDLFAKEVREVTAYNLPGGTLIEFASRLRSATGGTVHLDGDPQHAGFQFRAAQEVAEDTKHQTYYLRPDGKGEPGETRNWDHRNEGKPSNAQSTNLPFNAMSFVVGGQRYTAVYLDHPENPKPARYSERDYGRFGSYFVYDLQPGVPLEINYRIWLQEGEMTLDEVRRISADFTTPPMPHVKSVAGAQSHEPEPQEDNVPPEGFTALFNGKDLSGWKGLVANPPKRAQMSEEELAAAQEEADNRMREHWSVQEGVLVFDGEGDSLCTAKDYGDFELFVDWKIKPAGDSGIYLRGTPQVQIWDPENPSQFSAGVNLGSGSLWNNQKHARFPLQRADRPVGEWNTFHIRMVGEEVTIWLNGQLVVEDTVLENYWERDKPIYPTGQIELQNHGNTLYFKNIYIRELGNEADE